MFVGLICSGCCICITSSGSIDRGAFQSEVCLWVKLPTQRQDLRDLRVRCGRSRCDHIRAKVRGGLSGNARADSRDSVPCEMLSNVAFACLSSRMLHKLANSLDDGLDQQNLLFRCSIHLGLAHVARSSKCLPNRVTSLPWCAPQASNNNKSQRDPLGG